MDAGSIDGIADDALAIFGVVSDYTHREWTWLFKRLTCRSSPETFASWFRGFLGVEDASVIGTLCVEARCI